MSHTQETTSLDQQGNSQPIAEISGEHSKDKKEETGKVEKKEETQKEVTESQEQGQY